MHTCFILGSPGIVSSGFAQMFKKIASTRVKTLNIIFGINILTGKRPHFRLDVPRLKPPLLELPKILQDRC